MKPSLTVVLKSSLVWLYEAERRSLTTERGGHAKLNQGLGGS